MRALRRSPTATSSSRRPARVLCETTPLSDRPGPSFYAFGASPAHRAFGGTAQYPPGERAIERIRAFALAAIRAQPLAYAASVAGNLWQFVAPESYRSRSGNSPQSLIDALLSDRNDAISGPLITTVYGTVGGLHAPGIGRLRAYERRTRIDGVVMFVLLLLSLLAVALARGRMRAGVDLFGLVVLTLALTPVLTVFYDARYAVPVYPGLAAMAAIGGWLVWTRIERSSKIRWPMSPTRRSRTGVH